jgi:hypothetical protein
MCVTAVNLATYLKRPVFTALRAAAVVSLMVGSALALAAFEPLLQLPAHAQSAGKGNGNGKGPFQGGNNGNGPNPSRGNAGRNSGATSVSSSVMVPTIRFAPPAPN